jgi:8-oxo-dGTP diphosphatase
LLTLESAERRFWELCGNHLAEFAERDYRSYPFYVDLDQNRQLDKLGMAKVGLDVANSLIEEYEGGDVSGLDQRLVDLALIMLCFANKFALGQKVTADELRGGKIDLQEDVAKRAHRLVREKGVDYNSGGVCTLSYFIYGERSLLHEIHKKAQRLFSVVSAGSTPKFEDALATAVDLYNYIQFLRAFLEVKHEGYSSTVEAILATLCFVRKEGSVLLLRRGSGEKVHYNAPGGKVLPSESVLECARRELQEETGMELSHLKLRGIFRVFGSPRVASKFQTWMLFIIAGETTQDPQRVEGEGEPVWVPEPEVPDLLSLEGDRIIFESLQGDDLVEGILRYNDGVLVHSTSDVSLLD